MKYLEQILVALRQTHLIRGIKGFKGGYVIARPADKISFQEIIDALDVTMLGDADTGGAEDTSLLKATVQECLWDQMSAAVLQQHYVTGYDGSLSEFYSAGRGVYVLHLRESGFRNQTAPEAISGEPSDFCTKSHVFSVLSID